MSAPIQASSQQSGPVQRSSARQASRGTFKRMLAQRQQEEHEYAEFERAAEAQMQHGPRPAPHPAQSAAAPAAAAGCTVDADGMVVVKKRRGRPPKPRPPEPPKPFLMGPHLEEVLAAVRAAADNSSLAAGTPVWVKVTGYCAWPGLVWSLDLCARFTWPDVVTTYEKGKVLVRFYGDHSSSWVAQKQLLPWDEADVEHKSAALAVWGKKNNKLKLVSATVDELSARSDAPDEEMRRMDRLGRQYQLDYVQATARHRHSSLLRPKHSQVEGDTAVEGDRPPAAAETDGEVTAAVSVTAASAAAAAAAAAADGDQLPVNGNAWGACDVCREEVPDMRCSSCHRWLHALCSLPAALTPTEYPADTSWTCPCCGANNTVKVLPEEELLRQAAGQGVVAERMGLTPDWIISTTAFMVFQLPRPTADQPYIAGLLDPACNNKFEPNIPAEVLYDKKDDGLDPSNTWKGYYILLNPDYRAQVQWRFVNRAIDEVENGNVPAVLLVCRNSTDTAYFQRLRPYPRVLLRRCNTQFKDYDKCPIGFGVVVFCIATAAHHNCLQLYERFYKGFSPFGEPNIPIDTEFLSSPSFYQLLSRLRLHAEQHARDHWVQCSKCGVWRIISWQQQQALSSGVTADWTCNMLRPPLTSCATPQSKREVTGMAAAADGPQQAPASTTQPTAAAEAAAPTAGPTPGPGTPAAFLRLTSVVLPGRGSASPSAAEDQLGLCAADTDAEPCETAVLLVGQDSGGSSCSPGVGGDTGPYSSGSSARGSNTPPADPAEADGAPGSGAERAGAAAEQGSASHAAADTSAAAAAGAAGLLAVFEQEVAQLHGDIAAAYLCKSAAGQVTIQQARDVLGAAGAALGGSCSAVLLTSPAAAASAEAAAAESKSYIQSLADMLLPHRGVPIVGHARPEEQQQQQAEAAGCVNAGQAGLEQQPLCVQDIREQLLQVAADRPPKRRCLRWAPAAHAASTHCTGAGTGATHSAAAAAAAGECSHVMSSSRSPGLWALAPVVTRLVHHWLLHLVQELLLHDKQQDTETAQQGRGGAANQQQQQQSGADQQQQSVADQQPPQQRPVQSEGKLAGGEAAGVQLLPSHAAAGLGPTTVQIQSQDAADCSEAQQVQQVPGAQQEHKQDHQQEQEYSSPSSQTPPQLSQQQQQGAHEADAPECQPSASSRQTHTELPGPTEPTAVPQPPTAGCCAAPAGGEPTHSAAGDSQQQPAASSGGQQQQPAASSGGQQQQPAASSGGQQQQPAAAAAAAGQVQSLSASPHTAVRPQAIVLSAAAAAAELPAFGVPLPLPWGQQQQQQQQQHALAGLFLPGALSAALMLAPDVRSLLAAAGMCGNLQAGTSMGLQAPQAAAPVLQQQQQQLLLLQLLARYRAQNLGLAAAGTQCAAVAQPGGLCSSAAAAAAATCHASESCTAAASALSQPVAARPPALLAAAVDAPAAACQEHGLTQVGTAYGMPPPAAAAGTSGGQLKEATLPPVSTEAAGPQQLQPAFQSTKSHALFGRPAAPVSALVAGASGDMHEVKHTRGSNAAAVTPAAATTQATNTPSAHTGAAIAEHSTARSSGPGSGWGSPPPARVPCTHSAERPADHTNTAKQSTAGDMAAQPTATADAQVAVTSAVATAAAAAAARSAAGSLAGDSSVHRDSGLRPRAVWALTADPLLRAVLLQQPCLMEAVLALLRNISSHLQQRTKRHSPGGSSGAVGCLGVAAAGGGSGSSHEGAALPDVVMDALEALCSQPVLAGAGKWPQRPLTQAQQQQHEVADGADGLSGDVCEADEAAPDSTAEEAEMMSSLELARAARMAANRAYMLGLGLGQPATPATLMQQPSPAALEGNHTAVIAAARKLAQQAAVQRAKRQVLASQRLLDARRRARRQQEKRLQATLEALTADEVAAAKQVSDAIRTLQDVQQEAFGE